MSGTLTPLPDRLPIAKQDPRDRNERHAQKRKQSAPPVDPQAIEHGTRKQRETRAKGTPHEIIPRKHARRVLGVGVAEVVEDGVEQEEGADGEPAGADDGDDPMGAAGAPAEPEEADGEAEAADEGGREAELGLELTVGVEAGLEEAVQEVEEGRERDEGAGEDADVREAERAEREVVVADEDDREGLEPQVDEGVEQRDVQVEGEDDGLEEGEREGPHQDHHRDLPPRHALGFELRLGLERRRVGFAGPHLAQAHRAAVEDVGGGRLGEQEEDEDEAEAREPHELPDRPLPPFGLGREAADQRSEHGSEHGGDAPDGDAVGAFGGGVHVADGGAAGGQHGRAEEPGQEAEGKQHAEVFGVNDGGLETDEDDEGPDVDGVAADEGHFAQWRPDHGTQAVADDKHRQAEQSGSIGDVEMFLDAFDARGVDGGADVDGGREQADFESDEELFGH